MLTNFEGVGCQKPLKNVSAIRSLKLSVFSHCGGEGNISLTSQTLGLPVCCEDNGYLPIHFESQEYLSNYKDYGAKNL